MLIERLLARLDVGELRPDTASLRRAQRAWCFTQPFHNLDLLAAVATGAPPLGPEAALERCAAGLGGPCHVQAAAFEALLARIGLDTTLVGAAVSHPDDHLLVKVAADRIWYCDVGNGQPYLEPFADSTVVVQQHLGWVVRSTPVAEGLLVERASPDQPAMRRVYMAKPDPRSWRDFEATIARHHRQPGFGPFLTGLRIVRVGPTEMITVRDDVVTRYRSSGVERVSLGPVALRSMISVDLGLGALPVDAAVDAWLATRPT